MPTRPVSIETLRLIAAVRDALAEHLGADATVDERPLFGCHALMVNGKLCLAVKDDHSRPRLQPAGQGLAPARQGPRSAHHCTARAGAKNISLFSL